MEQDPNGDSGLDRQAIERAGSVFAQLRGGSQLFQECVDKADTISQLIKSIEERYERRRNKTSSRLLEHFRKQAAWLQNLSNIIDIAVQAQAEILCPIWAPIRFLLQVGGFSPIPSSNLI